MKALKAINYKDVLVRALWTFVQVFLAAFIVAGESIIDLAFKADWSGLWTLIVATTLASTAAGLSAVKTILVELVREMRRGVEGE